MSQSENPITIRIELCSCGGAQVSQGNKKCGCGQNSPVTQTRQSAETETVQDVQILLVVGVDKPSQMRVRVIGLASKDTECNRFPDRLRCKTYRFESGIPANPPSDGAVITPLTATSSTNPGHYDNWDGCYCFRFITIPCSWSPGTVYVVVWAEWDDCPDGQGPKSTKAVYAYPLNCDAFPPLV